MSNPSVPTGRWCEICSRYEKCHCSSTKSWCEVCVPTRRIAFDFRVELGVEVPPTIDPGAAWLRAVG